jgi:hypothetical protein
MEVEQSAVSDSAEVVVEVEQSAVYDCADNNDNVHDEIAVTDSGTVIETSDQTHDVEEEELDRLRQIYMDEGMATTTPPKRLPKTERKALAKVARKDKKKTTAEDETPQ